jgi:hypothetical protein
MAKLQQHKKRRGSSSRIKSNSSSQANGSSSSSRRGSSSNTRRFRDGSIRRCPVANLDTVAGEEDENGAEISSKQKDLMRQETSYNQEMRSLIQTQ